MRIVAALGFDWSHVVAVANRYKDVDEIVLVTADSPSERTDDAIEEIKRYAEKTETATLVAKVSTEDVWKCVKDVLEYLIGPPVVIDVGGGVRSLGLCLILAAALAIEINGAKVIGVYTHAEDKKKIVKVDLRPLWLAQRLKGGRAPTLLRLIEGKEPEDRYERNKAKELSKYGLDGSEGASALEAIKKAISLWKSSG